MRNNVNFSAGGCIEHGVYSFLNCQLGSFFIEQSALFIIYRSICCVHSLLNCSRCSFFNKLSAVFTTECTLYKHILVQISSPWMLDVISQTNLLRNFHAESSAMIEHQC